MTKEELHLLYKEKILPENRSPYHFEAREVWDVELRAYNPMCGDKYALYFGQTDGRVDQVHFHGIGCAISKASTSLLVRRMEGKSHAQIGHLCDRFLGAAEGDSTEKLADEELEVLAGLREFGGRMDCVKLSWKAVSDYVSKSQNDG